MSLKDMTTEEKSRAFDMVIEAYAKDSNLSEFGEEVQEIINFLNKYNSFKK